MGYNFIAFDFCDNDFHNVLHESIRYVVNNREEEIPVLVFREYVIRGMVAFEGLRRISNWGFENIKHDPIRYREYFEKTLTVSEHQNLVTLRDGFEGYIFDRNTLDVYYHAGY
jgi:hypothetical protein